MIEVLRQYFPNQYIRAFILILTAFIIIRFFIFILERVIIRLTKKTKTDIDDIIIERSSKPLTIIALLIGIKISIMELELNPFLSDMVSKIIFSAISLVTFYIAYVLVDVIAFRGLKKISRKTKSDIDDSLLGLVHTTLKAAWIVFALLFVLNLWGVKIGPLLAGIGIGGIAIAFALQSSLGNIFGGVAMIMDKTIKKGDLINLEDGTKGKILRVGLRSTRIQTFDNELVIVPNGKLADSRILNVTLPEPETRVKIPFGVAYGTDINKVKKIVMKEIKKIKHFVKKPEPMIKFLEMADSSLNLKAYFYVDSFDHRLGAIDEANTRIYNILNKHKIEIPFPQRDIHVKE